MAEPSYDLAELLRSPLEPDPDERATPPWVVWALAFVLGAVAGAIVVQARASAETPLTSVPTTSAAQAEPEVVVVEPGPFPAGYIPVANDVALRAEAPILLADRTLVPLTMVVRRGLEPGEVERPLGGRWELRTDTGVLASRHIIFDPIRPGVLTVEFPALDEPPREMILVERWDGTPRSGTVEIPWPGLPLESDSPLDIEVGAGATLRLTAVALSNFLGQVTWELDGAVLGTVALEIDLLEADGAVLGSYITGATDLDPEPTSGFINYIWEPSFRVDQNDASGVRFTATVVVGSPVDTEIAMPLGE